MKLKQSEIKSLQNETETLNQMIKQLDAQKSEARKRLDDLGVQVENLKLTLVDQKVTVEGQETEMLAKRQELDQLRSEEASLQSKLGIFKQDVDSLSQNLGQTQIHISQVKTKLLHLEEYERQLNEGVVDLDTAITNTDYHKITTLLVRPITPPPDLIEAKSGFDVDPFRDGFPSLTKEFSADPFSGEDPFKGG